MVLADIDTLRVISEYLVSIEETLAIVDDGEKQGSVIKECEPNNAGAVQTWPAPVLDFYFKTQRWLPATTNYLQNLYKTRIRSCLIRIPTPTTLLVRLPTVRARTRWTPREVVLDLVALLLPATVMAMARLPIVALPPVALQAATVGAPLPHASRTMLRPYVISALLYMFWLILINFGFILQNPAPSNVLGVFGLSIRTAERDLEDEFGRFGPVDKVTIVYDQRVCARAATTSMQNLLTTLPRPTALVDLALLSWPM